MRYLKPKQHYSDQYDRFTVEEGRRIVSRPLDTENLTEPRRTGLRGLTMGSYVPVSGSFDDRWGSGLYISQVDFTIDNSNANSISTYNSGNGTGGSCNGENAYLTLDVTAVTDGTESLDATLVDSDLPNPHYDMESDFFTSSYNEESETVALGSISSDDYYMDTYWEDERSGGAAEGGDIQAQFAMSDEGFSDYNNCVTANGVQIINSYNNTYGSL